ncbi:MAG TPA: hypothetical protein VN688_00215 [Gemmataceae bacterium]|nr:hypothetical protein [Gemmataceae bacterium]
MNPSEQTQSIQVGDTVTLRWEILQRRGWYLRDLLRARGQVTGFVPLSNTVYLRVAWDRPGLPTDFSPEELCRVAPTKQKASA